MPERLSLMSIVCKFGKFTNISGSIKKDYYCSHCTSGWPHSFYKKLQQTPYNFQIFRKDAVIYNILNCQQPKYYCTTYILSDTVTHKRQVTLHLLIITLLRHRFSEPAHIVKPAHKSPLHIVNVMFLKIHQHKPMYWQRCSNINSFPD